MTKKYKNNYNNNMHNYFNKILYILLFTLITHTTFAVDEFVIKDIRVEGLQRISPGTVFNYLPMKVGDTFDDARSAEAVRALFKTGFFDDVKLERDGDVLVIVIKERPSIASITLNGNKELKSKDLLDGLKNIGFSEGRIFNQSQLDNLEKELRRQYFSLGKYAVDIKSTVKPLDDNRVAVTIDISEGLTAKIKQINIIGNKSFPEKKLLKNFKSTTPKLFSFFTKSDQYSKEKLAADIESLKSFYLDHGYINFNVESTQVSITPDKKDIYITINITEGDQFTISDVKLAGDLILPEDSFFDAVKIKQGELFSRIKLTETTEAITNILGNDGYAFANVNAIPDINNDTKTVGITFFVDPGKRAYVRRITFVGNTRTRDEVLRQEMRQPEAAWVSTQKIERGKVRLQRLGYFKDVNVETPAVPGTTDQVDVKYTVEENPTGRFSVGFGFSQGAGFILQTSVAQDNFLGSGKRISFDFSNSDVNRRFGVGYLNPYWTIDGVSRGFNAYYRETNAANANSSLIDYSSQTAGGNVQFGFPLTEYNTWTTTVALENTGLSCNGNSSTVCAKFVAAEGSSFNVIKISNRFTYDTRNKAIFPDKGLVHSIAADVSVPSFNNSVEYYKLDYQTEIYKQIYEDYVMSFSGSLSYGDGYLDTSGLPFFENFFAGGPRSVRGFEDNTIGPVETSTSIATGTSVTRAIGGNFRMLGGAELIIPVPFLSDVKNFRISGFMDAGSVYNTNDSIDLGQMRYSLGISMKWASPFGLISTSIAQPFNDQPTDKIQQFQFTFGSSF